MEIDKSLLSGNTTLLVLSLLRDEEKYGYQIITELAKRSDDTFLLKEGTLYPILHNLENKKYVISHSRESEKGRIRKYYQITKSGLKYLDLKRQEWLAYCEKVNQVVLHPVHSMT
jgi:PadR family transcriptional regulator PadR